MRVSRIWSGGVSASGGLGCSPKGVRACARHCEAVAGGPIWKRELMLYIAHQLGVFVGEVFGLDMPRCYDIISTNGAVLGFGQIETLESDHDFVFAVISTKRDN